MLQNKFFSYGQHFLKIKFHSRLLFIPYGSLSYDQHESPAVPHHIHPTPTLTLEEKLPSSCHILIVGGGIIGQSIAYHLSEIGAKDIVLVEKAR